MTHGIPFSLDPRPFSVRADSPPTPQTNAARDRQVIDLLVQKRTGFFRRLMQAFDCRIERESQPCAFPEAFFEHLSLGTSGYTSCSYGLQIVGRSRYNHAVKTLPRLIRVGFENRYDSFFNGLHAGLGLHLRLTPDARIIERI
jgi:hypothetical protein